MVVVVLGALSLADDDDDEPRRVNKTMTEDSGDYCRQKCLCECVVCVPDYFTALLFGALVNESSSRCSSTNLSLSPSL